MAFIQYSFARKEHEIDIQPHGNAKKKGAFQRTKPSTLKLIKASVAENKRPLKILKEVESSQGGVMEAKLSCDLPRDRRQVYNFISAHAAKPQSSYATEIPRSDTLAHVMRVCKETSGDEAFIRSVQAAPEPMCVLTTNQQLNDVQRFCTGSPSSILSVDPTFNLGPFYVTPTTYQNLLVETERGQHPIVLGPILIHQTKTFQPFHYFASTLISLNTALTKLKAFGTDGEPELIKAFQVCFPQATHLRCTNHLRQNVKDKLRSLGITQSVSSEFLADIFGVQKGSKFEHGLIDATEASFNTLLEHLKHRWNNLERSCVSTIADPQFHSWFLKYKATDIKTCVLPSVREKAGSDPTCKFTTNMSESINHVIKQEVNWKESKLPVLIDHLKAVVHQHVEELQKAVIGRGEWKFKSLYRHLRVPQALWFSKTTEFKEKHMKKVQSTEVKGQALPSRGGNSTLSVPFENCGLTNIAESTLSNMWSKAMKLVESKGDVLNAPWLSDEKARLVKSTSSLHPHIVTTNKENKNLYCCDDKCPMFAGFSICSHVVAVAECNGDLRSFLDAARAKCTPNLTAIANQGLPKGAGRKGAVPKRKRKTLVPVESRSVRPCLVGAPSTSPVAVGCGQQLSNVTGPTQDASLCTDDFGLGSLLEGFTGSTSAVQSSSTLPIQSPSTLLSGCSSASFNSLQRQPCVSLPSMSFPSTTLSLPASTVSQAHSQGQLVLGTGVNFNIRPPSVFQSLPVVSNIGNPTPASKNSKPFTLKLKTNQIKICQSCRKNYEGENNTLDLVLAHPERKLISNPATGVQFWGRESNSHYHANMVCLKKVSASFEIEVPKELIPKLTIFQKVYVMTCLQVPPVKLDLQV